MQTETMTGQDPARATTLHRQNEIACLANAIEALFPIAYGMGDWLYADDACKLVNNLERSLVWRMAWAGALDGAEIRDECANVVDRVVKLLPPSEDPFRPDPWVETQRGGWSLEGLVDYLDCRWPCLPHTTAYGPHAVVELARYWLAQQPNLN